MVITFCDTTGVAFHVLPSFVLDGHMLTRLDCVAGRDIALCPGGKSCEKYGNRLAVQNLVWASDL